MNINMLPPPIHQQGTKQRIEYIDALRGFCMILVVYSHVLRISFDIKDGSTMGEFFLYFRMPLFFCISGFMCYKPLSTWTFPKIGIFLVRKVRQQLISTLFFIVLFSYVFAESLMEIFSAVYMHGYWFTWCLFAFFCIWLVYVSLIRMFRLRESIFTDLLLVILAYAVYELGLYAVLEVTPEKPATVTNCILGVYHYNYFIYFVFGILIRKYFAQFENLLDTKYFLPILTLFFIASYVYLNYISIWSRIGLFVSFSGLLLLFAYFRRYRDALSKTSIIGNALNYIGRRTLDIYLIHYFIIPRNLYMIGDFFKANNNASIEFVISISLSLLIVGLCCIVSSVFRMSPVLSWAVLGQKLQLDTKRS